MVLELFLSSELTYTDLVMNLGPVPLVPWGTTQSFSKKKQHNEKASNSMTFGSRSVQTI